MKARNPVIPGLHSDLAPVLGIRSRRLAVAAAFSLVEKAEAAAPDAFPWSTNVAGHIPAITAALRGEAAFWASAAVSPTGVPTYPLSPDVIQTGEDARAIPRRLYWQSNRLLTDRFLVRVQVGEPT